MSPDGPMLRHGLQRAGGSANRETQVAGAVAEGGVFGGEVREFQGCVSEPIERGGISSGEFDRDWLHEFVEETIRKNGRIVWQYWWDRGAPGETGSELAVKFDGVYFPYNTDQGYWGPFDTLPGALSASRPVPPGVG
jgi:predicted RNase H-like HicB family nuclease